MTASLPRYRGRNLSVRKFSSLACRNCALAAGEGSIRNAARRDCLTWIVFSASPCAGFLAQGPASASYVDELTAEAVFQSSAPSVVAIEDFKGSASEGVGSGFVWDTHGHIVTNYHCISNLARDESGKQVRQMTLWPLGCVVKAAR
jgi:S1-C subfamily serine protease